MADISMCDGVDCPQKESCYRFKAIPSKHQQAYFLGGTAPRNQEGICVYYWSTDTQKFFAEKYNQYGEVTQPGGKE